MNNISKISHLTERIGLCLEKIKRLETNINEFKGVDLLKLYCESRNCLNALNEVLVVVPASNYKQELQDLKTKFSDFVLDFEGKLATIVMKISTFSYQVTGIKLARLAITEFSVLCSVLFIGGYYG